MSAGRLKHRIQLQRRIDTQSPSGQVKYDYETFVTVWAEILPVSGREFFGAAQTQSKVTTKIRIRYRGDVDETCRAVQKITIDSPAEEKVFNIVAALPDQRTGRNDLWLYCEFNRAEGRE